MNEIILPLALIAVPVGIFLAVLAAASPPATDAVIERLRALPGAEFGSDSGIREHEMQVPFMQRVVMPSLQRASIFVSKFAPAQLLSSTTVQLHEAGNPWGISAGAFVFLQALGAVFFTVLLFVLAQLLALDMPLVIAVSACGVIVGIVVPRTSVDRAKKKRRDLMLRALPNALDLMTISLEAGMSFDASLHEVVEKYDNELSREFAIAIQEIRLGRPRKEVLMALAERVGVDEISSTVDAIIQSEQLGTPLAKVLAIQSEDIRRRFRQRAEELAQKAPIKMLIPMVGCIFPTLFVVLLGPAAITVLHQLIGK